MKSQTVETLLLKLGVAKSHSRPHVSNDNPFSEAAFKTLKYCPAFPARFGSMAEAEVFCQDYFGWYNERHHHTGLDTFRTIYLNIDENGATSVYLEAAVNSAKSPAERMKPSEYPKQFL